MTAVNSTLTGGAGNDVLIDVDFGDDLLSGLGGNDVLEAGDGHDTLQGGDDNDTLSGGDGNDELTGGAGSDAFVFNTTPNAESNVDTITDFNTSSDLILLDRSYFAAVAADGTLSATYFLSGDFTDESEELDFSSAGANHYILHDTTDGKIYYDQDGSNSGYSPILFATLTGVTTLTAASFKVFGNIYIKVASQSGGLGNDLLIGSDDNSEFLGGDGNDSILGSGGNDNLSGGGGLDSIFGGSGNDTLQGEAGNDQLTGDAGTDSLTGGTENDTLNGGEGNDTLEGDAGNDQLNGEGGNDSLVGGAGDDTLNGGADNDSLKGGFDADVMNGDGGDDWFDGSDNSSTDTIDGGDGADTLDFDLLSETINIVATLVTSGTSTINVGGGTDVISGIEHLYGGKGNDTVTGSSADNNLTGRDGNDSLTGGAGADSLDGGAGNDSLTGGAGVDSVIGGAGDDTVYVTGSDDNGSETLDGGTNTDTLNVSGSSLSLTSATLSNFEAVVLASGIDLTINAAARTGLVSLTGVSGGATESLILQGTSGADTISGGAFTTVSHAQLVVNGDAGADTLTGSGFADSLSGGADADSIDGAAGNDTLTGGAGLDVVNGGDDNDTIVVSGSDDTGNETLSGGVGTDTLSVTGSDLTLANAADLSDFESIKLAEGIDLTLAAAHIADNSFGNVTGTNGGVVEIVTFTGTGADNISIAGITVTDAQLVVNAGTDADLVAGSTSGDVLKGEAGNDTLTGGAGVDSVSGGDGDDTIQVTGANDGGNETLEGGNNTDTLSVQGSDLTLAAGATLSSFEAIKLASGIDLSLAASELGDNSIATVTGVNGGVVEQVTFTGTTGADTISLANITTVTDAQLVIVAGSGNDVITGSGSSDVLQGEAGSDTLNGGAGNDTLTGGSDADLFILNTTPNATTNVDVISDFVPGSDKLQLDNNIFGGIFGIGALLGRLRAGAGFTTAASYRDFLIYNTSDGKLYYDADAVFGFYSPIHIATLSGAPNLADADIEIVGNAHANVVGSAVADTLEGGSGNDTISGLAGADSLLGVAGNDTITGGDDNDTLDGGTGVDTLVGGAGDDTYYVNETSDVVTETEAAGSDTVLSTAVTYTLSSHVENGTINSSSAATLTGNELANTLTGNSGADSLSGLLGADVLNGLAGADTLHGGDGNDTLAGGSGVDVLHGGAGNDSLTGGDDNDRFIFDVAPAASGNTDTISDFVPINEKIVLDNNVFTALTGVGTLQAARFSVGSGLTTATEFDDFIIYDTATGNLYYDADGSRSTHSALHFATLGGAPNDLSRFDFEITGIANALLNGTAAGDTLLGGSGADTITGVAGADSLYGGAGNDTINGGTEADSLDGGDGDDTLDGGDGTDTLYFNDATAALVVDLRDTQAQATGNGSDVITNIENLYGSSGGDNFIGRDDAANRLEGNAGSDTLEGGGGDDTLLGGDDDDSLVGGSGDDSIDGGAGSDKASYSAAGAAVTVSLAVATAQNTGGAGTDTLTNVENLSGSAFGDSLTGGTGNNSLYGNAGNDTLTGGGGTDSLYGGDDADTLIGGSANDLFDGGAGTDLVSYANAGAGITISLANSEGYQDTEGAGHDKVIGIENLTGSSYHDHLTGSASDNVIRGNDDGDELSGLAGNDQLYGDAGADTLIGGTGNDTLDGGDGIDIVDYSSAGGGITLSLGTATNDTGNDGTDVVSNVENIAGSAYHDHLTGNEGANEISGNDGGDELFGGGGDDKLHGGDNNWADTLEGGNGNDTLTGGQGNDRFVFNTVPNGTNNVDVITDFFSGDLIVLDNAIFTGLGSADEALAESALRSGEGFTEATTADHRLIYNRSTGELFYDSDGTGANAKVLISTLNYNEGYYSLVTGSFDIIRTAGQNLSGASVTGGIGDDTITGTAGADTLLGADGHDSIVGDAGNDSLDGGNFLDTLKGGADNDTLKGGPGDDVLYGGAGDDSLDGGSESDTVSYSDITAGGVTVNLATVGAQNTVNAGNDTLTGIENLEGSGQADTLTGNGSANVLKGGVGNDTIDGATGNDTLYGGTGDDRFAFTTSLNAGSNVDTINDLGAGDKLLLDNAIFTSLTTVGDLSSSLFYAAEGVTSDAGRGADDYLLYDTATGYLYYDQDGSSTTHSPVHFATIVDAALDAAKIAVTGQTGTNNGGTDGNDVLDGGNYDDTLGGGLGNDTLRGNNGNDSLNGEDGDDSLEGGAGADTLNGGIGNDTLQGNAGADSMTGGAGNDVYYVDDANDDVIETDGIASSGGKDQVYSSLASYTLDNNVEEGFIIATGAANITGNSLDNFLGAGSGGNTIDGAEGVDTASYSSASGGITASLVTGSVTGASGTDVLHNIEGINGSAHDDSLTGNAANNSLFGNAGNDSLYGGDGDDMLVETSGDDVIDGGNGTDRLSYNSVAAAVTVNLNTTSQQNTGGAGNDTITNVENLTGGSGNDVFTGTSGNNNFEGGSGNDSLVGNAGNDSLNGGAGVDTMIGGDGNDLYYVDSAGETVTETNADEATGGTDTVLVSLTTGYVLPANVERGTINTSSAANLTGNSLSNWLTPGQGNNTLYGGEGTEVDWVSYSSTNATNGSGIVVTFAASSNSAATVTGGSGTDTLNNIENVFGSQYADTITGGNGKNVLDGGDGNDTLNGGDGDDNIHENSGDDSMDGGAGYDMLDYHHYSTAITVSLAITTAQTTGAGNDTITGIENLRGGSGNDSLTGDGAANNLYGAAGNDTLNGGSGDDTLEGAGGTDSLTGGGGGDQFFFKTAVEAGNTDYISDFVTGTDEIFLHNSVFDKLGGRGDLPSGYLKLGTAAADADDYLIFNSTNNTLYYDSDGSGATAAVAIAILQGVSSLSASDIKVAGDVVTTEGATGSDTLNGSAAEDYLYGRAGNDSIFGGAGNDFIEGGSGNDTINGGDGIDTISYATATVNATIELGRNKAANDGEGGSDQLSNIENAIGSSLNDIIIGSNVANKLEGEGGNDIIEGMAGEDTLIGGNGHDWLRGGADDDKLLGDLGLDTLTGGSGADEFIFHKAPASTNADRITDFAVAEDYLGFDVSIFTSLPTDAVVPAEKFRSGADVTTAADSNDYLIYNTSNGNLYYDADGDGGSHSPQLVVTLVGIPALTAGRLYGFSEDNDNINNDT